MRILPLNEEIEHKTGDFPLAYYHVDETHPRYRMRMHWHMETEIIRVERGSLDLFLGENMIPLSEGDALILGEGMLHGGEPAAGTVYECVVFDPITLLAHPEYCRAAVREYRKDSYLTRKGDPLEKTVQTVFSFAKERELMKTLGMLYVLFGSLGECEHLKVEAGEGRVSAKADQIKPALEYIEKNYASRITLDALARLTGLSPKYFCRSFRAIVHASPIEYINHYRIECASDLLTTTDSSVADIAQMCGFNDSSFFIKQFRRYKGTTPHRYKKED